MEEAWGGAETPQTALSSGFSTCGTVPLSELGMLGEEQVWGKAVWPLRLEVTFTHPEELSGGQLDLRRKLPRGGGGGGGRVPITRTIMVDNSSALKLAALHRCLASLPLHP